MNIEHIADCEALCGAQAAVLRRYPTAEARRGRHQRDHWYIAVGMDGRHVVGHGDTALDAWLAAAEHVEATR